MPRPNLIIIITIILGLLYVITTPTKLYESFGNKCPDVLIEKEGTFYLFNSNLAEIPGVNPVTFNNLEDYVEYIDWQRSQQISCPVLYLQQSFNAQGDTEYKQRPSPVELHGGLPPAPAQSKEFNNDSKLLDSNRNDPPYNKNSYPGFDPENQYIGLNTPLDKLFHQDFDGDSPNPMDSNWCGQDCTQALVEDGYYEENNVYRYKS